MIKHIPHSSTYIPYELKCFIGKAIDLSDKGVIEIFGSDDALIFPVSRLVCDVERLVDNESMEEKGMGICYTNNANLEPMRLVSPEEKEYILNKYYYPHHNLLELMVERELTEYGQAVIIDCHTYRKEPWPYEDNTKIRPYICIGYDKPSWVSEYIEKFLNNELAYSKYDIGINTPFSGSITPLKYKDDNRVNSVMLEIRQDMPKLTIHKTMERMLHGIKTRQKEKKLYA